MGNSVPKQCEAFSAPVTMAYLARCEYDAEPDSGFCYFHSKVIAGQITTIDGKPGRGHELSWRPRTVPEPAGPPGPLEQLMAEWA